MKHSIFDYGAKGDGLHKDHLAIQQAMDAVHASGGGRVSLPRGRYLCGTLWLRSHVELHLEHGAEIIGSPDLNDYHEADAFPENQAFSEENVTGRHLIVAYRQENVVLSGSGTINGNSTAFLLPLAPGESASYGHKTANYQVRDQRPGQMIYFCLCRNVRVTDLHLINATYWTLFLHGCTDLSIHGLRIENPPATPNGDGIDIDCCRHVTVSDCIIRSGDDCLTLRANAQRLGVDAQPCEAIVIQNCILSTPCNAIRVGVGDGEIRQATFTNLVIKETRTAISIVSNYSGKDGRGVLISGIHFSHLLIDAAIPFSINNGINVRDGAAISEISFAHITARGRAASQIVGSPGLPIRGISFQDLRLTLCEGSRNLTYAEILPESLTHYGFHGQDDTPALPFGLYASHLEGFRLHGATFRWERPSPLWRTAIRLDHAQDVRFDHLEVRQPQESGAAVECREVENLCLSHCHAALQTDCFLLVDDATAETLQIGFNTFEHASDGVITPTHDFV